jgi:hypothetical protein
VQEKCPGCHPRFYDALWAEERAQADSSALTSNFSAIAPEPVAQSALSIHDFFALRFASWKADFSTEDSRCGVGWGLPDAGRLRQGSGELRRSVCEGESSIGSATSSLDGLGRNGAAADRCRSEVGLESSLSRCSKSRRSDRFAPAGV